MKVNYLKSLFLVSTFIFCFSCSSDDDSNGGVVKMTPGKIQLSDVEKTMVGENNNFGVHLFTHSLSLNCKGAVCSPVDASVTMGMLANGLQGKSLRRQLEIMHMENHALSSVNYFYAKLLTNAPLLDEQVTLAMAHGIYGSATDSVYFNPQYIDCQTNYYQADVQTIDFSKAGSRQKATDWLKLHSNGMNVYWQNENHGTLLLGSFVNFGAKWRLTSANAERREVDFTAVKGGHKQSVKMTVGDFASVDYTDNERLQAVNLPLGQGKYNMLIFMPQEGATEIDYLMWEMNDTRMKQLLAAMQKRNVHMELPDISQENDVDLIGHGDEYVEIFAGFADFDPMLQNDCRNANVRVAKPFKEQVRLNISAEVTAGDAMGESPRQSFVANRPFGYIVYEKDTGIIFFIGMYYGQ